MSARGLRNANPGNIRRGPIQWVGMAPEQHDLDFVTFAAPEYGIRAIAKILHTYQVRTTAADSVRDLISRWAPPSENDTEAYVAAVAQAVGVDPDAPLPLDGAWRVPFIAALIMHENGSQPYPLALIEQAVQLA
jgi:hypothetical protein